MCPCLGPPCTNSLFVMINAAQGGGQFALYLTTSTRNTKSAIYHCAIDRYIVIVLLLFCTRVHVARGPKSQSAIAPSQAQVVYGTYAVIQGYNKINTVGVYVRAACRSIQLMVVL